MRTQHIQSPGLNFITLTHPKGLLKYASLLHHSIVSRVHLLSVRQHLLELLTLLSLQLKLEMQAHKPCVYAVL